MRIHSIPWYANEVTTAVGPPECVDDWQLLARLGSILTRWLAKEVPHGTTKRRLKKLHLDAIAWDAEQSGDID